MGLYIKVSISNDVFIPVGPFNTVEERQQHIERCTNEITENARGYLLEMWGEIPKMECVELDNVKQATSPQEDLAFMLDLPEEDEDE